MGRWLVWGLAVILMAAGAWIGWWYIGAEGQRSAFELWLEKQRERGWQAEAGHVEITGFPGAFRLTVNDLSLADPSSNWSWRAPVLNAESSAAAPTRISVHWPDAQSLGTTKDQIKILSDGMQTLLDLRPGPSMELREAATQARNVVAEARSGWTGSAAEVDLGVTERPEDLAPPNSYDLRGKATSVKLPKTLIDELDPTGLLKPSIDEVTLVGHAALADPIDRIALEEGRIAVRAATIREAGFSWGDMKLVIKGAFQVDDAGFPDGKLQIIAREWQKIVKLAVASGAIDATMAETIVGAVKLVTAFTGSGNDLNVPLGLKNGEIRLGPFALAAAPRLAPPR
ncbi:MAG: DUF2125 domain-containing protein [Pseudomonadota bacterium]